MSCIKCVLIVLAMLVAFHVLENVSVATPFKNGDFSAGFTGWQGDAGGNILDPAADPLFSITPDQMAIVKSDLVLFPVTLFQNFTMSPTATTISFLLDWQPTGQDDFIVAMLGDQAGLLTPIDLLAGLDPLNTSLFTADISSFAGQDVQIYFSLLDLSFDPDLYEPDVTKIDNIVIAQADPAVPVPEPVTILLLGGGLAGIGFVRRRK